MSRIIARAESWERTYQAFQNVNFAAFDYNTVKQSLIDYIKLYFPETFNDFIESSEFIAIIEMFAYIAELVAYRLDVTAHENFISTAQRKDSILRLAKLVSYTASRALPARGLVKITSVSTTEPVLDSQGVDLSGRVIRWNDATNTRWKEQFIAVMNRALQQNIGTVGPTDRFQIQDVVFESYTWDTTSLASGVFSYNALINGTSAPMELVSASYDKSLGIIERRPSNSSTFALLYGQDGLGDASDTTGFFCFTKQGQLQRFRTQFDGITPNLTYDIDVNNVNETDVWVNHVDPITGATMDEPSILPYRRETRGGKSGEWVPVDLAHAQNVIFNTNPRRNKYEVETRDGNRVRIIFGDGEFADMPLGTFDIWARTSLDEDITVPQSSVTNVPLSFTYLDSLSQVQTFSFTISLINSLQNASASEDIEHVRVTAPAVYYSQDRMVNGEDYNGFMLQDPSILRLRAINRTFAGDSKYITWHDASGSYENVKVFGDDGILYFYNKTETSTTPVVDVNTLINTYIEPLLSSLDVYMQLNSAGLPSDDHRRSFTTEELVRLNAALTPPPTPVQVDLYFNTTTNQWYAIKRSDDPSVVLTNWPSQFIPFPVISINQTSVFETRYVVQWVAKKLIFQSPTTTFWNTNQGDKVVDYDTLRSNSDEIVILQANLNCNRDGVLKNNWKFDVVGQEVVDVGEFVGLPDPQRLSIVPTDDNQDGIPDHTTMDSLMRVGLSDIATYKYTLTAPDLTALPLDGTVDYTLPAHYAINPVDPDIVLDGAVRLEFNGVVLQDNTNNNGHWGVSPSGTYSSNKIRFFKSLHTLVPSTAPAGWTPPQPGDVITIRIKDYVYFTRTTTTEAWSPAPLTTETIESYVADVANNTGLWSRHEGRGDLNFAWFHYTPRYHLVDPSPTNIIDAYIITKGYYLETKRWLESSGGAQPMPPSALDLRTSYGYMVDNKMISDTLVLHPGKLKLLFGPRSAPAVQGIFKIVRSADRTMTDNQIKTTVVSTIRNFFDITKWEFGETFYFTELAAVIHAALPTEIASVVLVPTLSTNQFGDMFQVRAREDEIFYADVTVDQIEIVTGYNPTNLRLNG